MEYRTLGKTDFKISILGLGGIPLQRITGNETQLLIDTAHNKGINFIDTARAYSVSEELIGQGLSTKRKEFILASKSMQRSKDGILKDIHITLKNLKTDYIDLYQIHNVRRQEEWDQITAPDGALAGLQKAKEDGIIRHLGFTSHSSELMDKALDSNIFATMMFPYNVVESQNKQLFDKAHRNNIGTMSMKPLAGGFIADADKALRYIAANVNVDCILVGMNSAAEIEKNIQALEKGSLSAEELKELEVWAANAGQDFCRRCGYCLPCPQGIDIPSVFLFEGYYDRYELQGWALDRYQAMPVDASACKACGQCQERCPYSLPIPEKLRKAAEKLSK